MPPHDHTFVSNWPQKWCWPFLLERAIASSSLCIWQLVLLVRRMCEAISIHGFNSYGLKSRRRNKKTHSAHERIEKNSAAEMVPQKMFTLRKWIEWIHISRRCRQRTEVWSEARKKTKIATKKCIAVRSCLIVGPSASIYGTQIAHRLECAPSMHEPPGKRAERKKKRKSRIYQFDRQRARSKWREKQQPHYSFTFAHGDGVFAFRFLPLLVFIWPRRPTSTSIIIIMFFFVIFFT